MENIRLIEVKENILADNDQIAGSIRQSLGEKGIFLLNIMASPGGGKTTLILKTIRELKKNVRMAVIEGDIDSIVDSEKVANEGIPAVQLRTGGACHLEAVSIQEALADLPLGELDLIIIENVGNLVCPAEFDTGSTKNMVILSVPEGDDKPLKYPLIFSVCDVLVVSKIDYLAMSDFDMKALKERALKLNPKIKIFELSARTGEGIPAWIEWLRSEIKAVKST
jgi:hydrogenase nickel incorporation protein HypB